MWDAKRHQKAGYMAHSARISSPQQVLVTILGYHTAGSWDIQPSLCSGQQEKDLGEPGLYSLGSWRWKVIDKTEEFLLQGVNDLHKSVQQPLFTHGTPPHFNSAHAHILSDLLAMSMAQPKASHPKDRAAFPAVRSPQPLRALAWKSRHGKRRWIRARE